MSASQQHDSVKVVELRPEDEARRSSARRRRRGGLAERRRRSRDKAQDASAAAQLLIADRSPTAPRRRKHDRAEHARQARRRLVRGRGRDGGQPGVKAGGKLKLEGFGQRFDGEHYVTLGHPRLRPRRLPHALRDQRPQPAHAHRRDAPEERARLDARASSIGIVTNNQDPEKLGRVRVKFARSATSIESNWARIALADAGKESRHGLPPRGGRRGRRRLRARRHAPPRRARRAAQRDRRAAREDGRRQGRRLARRLRPQGRRDQPPEAARDRRQGQHDDHDRPRRRRSRRRTSSTPRIRSRSRPAPRSSLEGTGDGDDQVRRRHQRRGAAAR